MLPRRLRELSRRKRLKQFVSLFAFRLQIPWNRILNITSQSKLKIPSFCHFWNCFCSLDQQTDKKNITVKLKILSNSNRSLKTSNIKYSFSWLLKSIFFLIFYSYEWTLYLFTNHIYTFPQCTNTYFNVHWTFFLLNLFNMLFNFFWF